jgi:hypothetical protein
MLKKPVSFRDLTIIELNDSEVLVIACDSLGGIGPKINDRIKVPGEILGMFTARVPLMEVMAAGAKPVALVNTLSVEMSPTGAEIIKGIKNEVQNVGLEKDLIINGSTEENIPTIQTGLGVTVIGQGAKSELRLGSSKTGALVVCLGRPKVGEEVLDGSGTADLHLLKKVLKTPGVQEVLPVGSRGIRYEAQQLAWGAKLNLKLLANQEIDLEKSAGPSTCLLVSIEEKNWPQLVEKVDYLPIYKIGYLQ